MRGIFGLERAVQQFCRQISFAIMHLVGQQGQQGQGNVAADQPGPSTARQDRRGDNKRRRRDSDDGDSDSDEGPRKRIRLEDNEGEFSC